MDNRFKRWITVALISFCLILSFPVLVGIGAASCSLVWHKNQKDFNTISLGESKEAVLSKMGKPSHIEKKEDSFHRYANDKCENDCYERIWYEARWCMDLRAWSISLDKNERVIDKFDRASP